MTIPVRTKLFSLPILDFGTGRIESLHGYLKRLTRAHRMEVGGLLRALGLAFHPTRGIPKVYWPAVVADLKAATMQPLEYTTVRSWYPLLARRHVYRQRQVWCRLCLVAGTESPPLSWALQAINACADHGCPLSDRCDRCDSQFTSLLPPPDWRCISCGHDLKAGRCATATDWEIFKAKQVESALGARTSEAQPISAAVLVEELKNHFGTKDAVRAHLGIGGPRSRLPRFSLDQLIYVSALLKIPLLSVFDSNLWGMASIDTEIFDGPERPLSHNQIRHKTREALSRAIQEPQRFASAKDIQFQFDISSKRSRKIFSAIRLDQSFAKGSVLVGARHIVFKYADFARRFRAAFPKQPTWWIEQRARVATKFSEEKLRSRAVLLLLNVLRQRQPQPER